MRHLRFSITTLLLVTIVICVSIVCWPIPDGFRSYQAVHNRAEFVWYDDAKGMVDERMWSPFKWSPATPIEGPGSVISLLKIEYGTSLGGGLYTEIQIQLPANVRRWQQFRLTPPILEREYHQTLSPVGSTQSAMNLLEVAVTQFTGSSIPLTEPLKPEYFGQVTILGATEDVVTVELQLEGLAEFGIEDAPTIYSLERKTLE